MGTKIIEKTQSATWNGKQIVVEAGNGSVDMTVIVTQAGDDAAEARLSVAGDGRVFTRNHGYSSLKPAQAREAGVDTPRVLELGTKLKSGQTLTESEVASLGSMAIQATDYVRDRGLEQTGQSR